MKKFRYFWITSASDSAGYPGEQNLCEALRGRGHTVIPFVWDQSELPNLEENDRMIIRTPDYVGKPETFARWLDALPDRQVFNSKKILRWNSDKRYLRELEVEGVRILPTIWIPAVPERFVQGMFAQALEKLSCVLPPEEWVVKPVFSAGAFHTYRLRLGEFPPADAFTPRAAMVQRFQPEILEDGERSIVFFRGELSHAIRKRPVTGEFRVQESFGGRFEKISLTDEEMRFATHAIGCVSRRFPEEGPPLYGRVDYLMLQGVPHLMELELFEPDLYLHHAPEAQSRFLRALESL